MKKIYLLFAVAAILFAINNSYSQNNYVLLEYCTGTWCQWCPCGDQIAENIQTQRPNTLILAYHGPANTGSDPFSFFTGNSIISTLGFSAYPTGIIGRRSGIVDRGSWSGWVSASSNLEPGVSYNVTKNYNTGTRQLQVTANVTSLRNIDSTAKINFVVYEDNIIYNQTGNGSCPGSATWNHKWVVRNMVNGPLGEDLSTGTWTANTMKSKNWTTTLDAGWNANNVMVAVFVYLSGGALSSGIHIMQTYKDFVIPPTGVGNPNSTPAEYSLSQNYPNPFNPTSNIHFNIPNDANVTLKIFDMLGHEVASYINGEKLQAGSYNVEVDASSWASGVYFYTLQANDFTATKKMMLVK